MYDLKAEYGLGVGGRRPRLRAAHAASLTGYGRVRINTAFSAGWRRLQRNGQTAAPAHQCGTKQKRELSQRRFSRFRLSVRALMGVVLVLAVGMGCYVRSVATQRDAVAAIRRAGGSVAYDWRWEGNKGTFMYSGKPLAPRWLAKVVPADYIATVISVDLDLPARAGGANPIDGETLAHIGRLSHLNSLWLNNRIAISDADLATLEGLTSLKDLQLDDTDVSDAGLARLGGMTALRKLCISRTRVTDKGVLELERALPRLWIYRSEETPSPAEIARSSVDLDYARAQPVLRACGLLAYRANRYGSAPICRDSSPRSRRSAI